MQCITQIQSLRNTLAGLRRDGRSIALVPTMGNLHAGHIHLIASARSQADIVVSSIFVNPMQFGENEDLDAYPRTLAQDIEKLEAAQCDFLFTPTADEMYPLGHAYHTVVSVPELSTHYCGASRPGHFDGVATIVSKLFNIVQPDIAVFGLKDYQQFLVIKKLVADLCQPIRLLGAPTQREASGLALSSRNGYLSTAQKQQAVALIETLRWAAQAIQEGGSIALIEEQGQRRIIEAGLKPDYFKVCHAHSLRPATASEQELVILAAAYLAKTRLIDNILLTRKAN